MNDNRESLIRKLASIHADTRPHTGRSLMEHLIGVHDILVNWDNPWHISAAGMFHSIYGTSAYDIVTIPITDRGRLQDLIGIEAERLVYLYCVTDRSELLRLTAEVGAPGNLPLRDKAGEEKIAPGELPALFEILYADRVEQAPHRRPVLDGDMARRHLRPDAISWWGSATAFLSTGARSHIEGQLRQLESESL